VDEITKAGVFDGMAAGYDEDDFHARVADALLAGLPEEPGLVLDVATGTGFAAFAVLRLRPARVLGVDLSPAMIARAMAKAPELDPDGRITWQVGSALPMPVPGHSADVVVCASSLHFLGAAALPDWRRVLAGRPGRVQCVARLDVPAVPPVRGAGPRRPVAARGRSGSGRAGRRRGLRGRDRFVVLGRRRASSRHVRRAGHSPLTCTFTFSGLTVKPQVRALYG